MPPLDAAARVLWPGAVHPVREQHHQPGLEAPLGLSAAHKRVLCYITLQTYDGIHQVEMPQRPFCSGSDEKDVQLQSNEPSEIRILDGLTRMICAPLKKSPNCASQMIRFLGFSTDIPYSKARTASSERMLLAISRRPPLPPLEDADIREVSKDNQCEKCTSILLKGMWISLLAWSTSIA